MTPSEKWRGVGSAAAIYTIDQRGWPSTPGLTLHEIGGMLWDWFSEIEPGDYNEIMDEMYKTLSEGDRVESVHAFAQGFKDGVEKYSEAIAEGLMDQVLPPSETNVDTLLEDLGFQA